MLISVTDGRGIFCEIALRRYHWSSLITSQYWSRYWFGAVRQQAITWSNVDSVQCSHMVSLGHNELSESHRRHQSGTTLTLSEGNLPVTCGFPLKRTSNVKSVYMPWQHHDDVAAVVYNLPWHHDGDVVVADDVYNLLSLSIRSKCEVHP